MNSLRKNALRVAPAMTALGALLLFAPQMQAQDEHRGDCRDRVEHAQSKLDHEIDEHGQDSLQARHARHELNEAREHCDASYGDQRQYDNRSAGSGDYQDNGRYNDRRDDDRNYRDNSQYNRNDNGQYNDPNYNPNNQNPNNNPNYNNGQAQPPYPDQQPH